MEFGSLVETSRSGRSSLKTLKYKNRHAVLQYLRRHDHASVAEIAKQTSLSKMTVHNIMEHYLKTGLVMEDGKGDSTDEGGKKPKLFAFNPDFKYIFSVRVMERYLSAALANLNGEISASHTAVHGADASIDEILGIIHESFHSLTKRRKVEPENCLGAVIGNHGVIDVSKGVCVISPHFPSWGTDVPLHDLVARQLPEGIPVFIDNWMRYHAYGELRARPDRRDRFYLIGTGCEGIAGGLVADGKLQHGDLCLAGEIGHMVVEPGGDALCSCGGRGCFEAKVIPNRLEAMAGKFRDEYSDSVLFRDGAGAGGRVAFDAIVAASNEGDALGRRLMDEAVKYFAVAITNLMYSCDPGLFIIQGAYARAGEYFLTRLRERVGTLSIPGMKKDVGIEYSVLDEEYSLVGGACYIADLHFENMLSAD